MNINHELLCSLGVGHPSLTIVCQQSREAGFASKLTGAGGGGCAITLLGSTVLNQTNTSRTLEDHLRLFHINIHILYLCDCIL